MKEQEEPKKDGSVIGLLIGLIALGVTIYVLATI